MKAIALSAALAGLLLVSSTASAAVRVQLGGVGVVAGSRTVHSVYVAPAPVVYPASRVIYAPRVVYPPPAAAIYPTHRAIYPTAPVIIRYHRSTLLGRPIVW